MEARQFKREGHIYRVRNVYSWLDCIIAIAQRYGTETVGKHYAYAIQMHRDFLDKLFIKIKP